MGVKLGRKLIVASTFIALGIVVLIYGYWNFYMLFLAILLIVFGLAYLFHKPVGYGEEISSSTSGRNDEGTIGRDHRDRRQSALNVGMMDVDIRNIRG